MSKDEKSLQANVNVETTVIDAGSTRSDNADNELLAQLGYKAEFKREFSVRNARSRNGLFIERRRVKMLETIAFSISIMGVIASITSTFSFVLVSGGHVGMVWGWFIPCFFVMAVALSMAELASSMPTSAGLYYFSSKLAPPKYAPLASWITGWANITGQVTLVCSIDFTCAQMITSAITVGSDGAIVLSSGATYGILLTILFCHGLVCSAATHILARLNLFYVIVNGGTTVAAIVAFLVCSGDNKVSTKDAFTLFENNTGWANNGWAFLLAFTAPMWTLTGYDSAAHISEEVAGAQRSAPIAIILGVASTEILGWLVLIAASFATKSVSSLLTTDLPLPMGTTISKCARKARHVGNLEFYHRCAVRDLELPRVLTPRVWSLHLLGITLSPGSRWWKQINRHTQTPVNAVWFVMVCAAICGLLGFSAAALSSLAGASVIGLYVSYATPIFLRITSGRGALTPGYFSLGRWYMPIGVIAVSWVAFIVVLLLFPPSQTATAEGMNYAVVIILGVFMFASISWVVSAHKWFHGPIKNIDATRTASLSDTKQ
ncbi:amino acid transporter [Chiua virens]|nr:amino acid transporter [Chiua virens]